MFENPTLMEVQTGFVLVSQLVTHHTSSLVCTNVVSEGMPIQQSQDVTAAQIDIPKLALIYLALLWYHSNEAGASPGIQG